MIYSCAYPFKTAAHCVNNCAVEGPAFCIALYIGDAPACYIDCDRVRERPSVGRHSGLLQPDDVSGWTGDTRRAARHVLRCSRRNQRRLRTLRQCQLRADHRHPRGAGRRWSSHRCRWNCLLRSGNRQPRRSATRRYDALHGLRFSAPHYCNPIQSHAIQFNISDYSVHT